MKLVFRHDNNWEDFIEYERMWEVDIDNELANFCMTFRDAMLELSVALKVEPIRDTVNPR